VEGFAEEGRFLAWNERVCDGKLIIISMTVSSINDRMKYTSGKLTG